MLAALYAIAITILTIYGGNLLWMAVRHARSDRLMPGRVPEPGDLPPAPAEWPAVTVQIPLYNEPLVAERVIDACAGLDYPTSQLEIQVLDDSTDATVERVARRVDYWHARGVDIAHVRREHRDEFKAGALRNGLRWASGSFVAIFDADFIPPPDFLRRTIPCFTDDSIAVVQARWGHLNPNDSLLTRAQTLGLDAHFAIEQRVRGRAGLFQNFNGTAGVWRRQWIEGAGGWHGDTITEDLDLSYRAQLEGGRFLYLHDVEVPAELPSTMAALRSQQFRWAKGSIETARKLLRPLLASNLAHGVKVQGIIHLTGHLVFPCILTAALLHTPILVETHFGRGPGAAYFGLMTIGLFGLAGFALAQIFAQRDLYPDWPRRLRIFPAFMVGSIGLSVHNSRAVAEAILGRRTPFIRTPKFNRVGKPPRTTTPSQTQNGIGEHTTETDVAITPSPARRVGGFTVRPFAEPTAPQPGGLKSNAGADHRRDMPSVASRKPSTRAPRKPSARASQEPSARASRELPARAPRKPAAMAWLEIPAVAWLELAAFVYSAAGLVILAGLGEWSAVPFQAVFAAGFGLVVLATFQPRAHVGARKESVGTTYEH